jgi:hypothetical protein
MIKLRVTAVEQPRGESCLVLGVRDTDLREKVVGLFVSPDEAVSLCSFASSEKEFPNIEVEDKEWFYVLNTGERMFLHVREKS